MDEDVIADLKQFIANTVSQHMAGFATKDDLQNFATKDDLKNLATKDDIKALRKELRQEIRDVKNAINESVIPYAGHIDEQVQDHEKRLTKLEHQAA